MADQEYFELTDSSEAPVRDYQSGDRALVVNGNSVAMVDMDSAQIAMDAKVEQLRGWIAGRDSYTTLALATAAGETTASVEVTNDPTNSNNGIWVWDNGTLIPSEFDPLRIAQQQISRFADEDGYNESEYSWAVVDGNDFLLIATNKQGEIVGKVSIDALPPLLRDFLRNSIIRLGSNSIVSDPYPYIWTIVDGNDFLLAYIDSQGRFTCKLHPDSIDTIPAKKIDVSAQTEAVDCGGWMAYTKSINGVRRLYSNNADNTVSVLDARDCSRLAPMDGGVTYDVDDVQYYVSEGSEPVRLLPKDEITCWGDSITQGAGADTPGGWPSILSENTGLKVNNEGIGGQKSHEIAARANAVPILITLADLEIPSDTTPVDVTEISQEPLNGQRVFSITGTVSGVACKLTRISSGVYTVERLDDGDGPVSVEPQTRFYPDTGDRLQTLTVIWVGTNNTQIMDVVVNDIAAIIDQLNVYKKRYLVVSLINGDGGHQGTTQYSQIAAINDELIRRWPDNFVDVRTPMINAYDPNSPGDVEDFNGDTTPRSLRVDMIHPNEAGYTIIEDKIRSTLNEKGWLL